MEHALQPSLVYSPHPILAAAGRELRHAAFQQGETIAEYLARVGIDLSRQPVVLALNDRVIERDAWSTTIPREGDLITVRARMQGGGGSNPLRIILTIVVLIAAVYLGPLVGNFLLGGANLGIAAGIQGAIGTALVMTAGNMLVNAIAPLPTPKLPGGQGDKPSPTYAINGGSNRARLFEPLPLIIGTHRVMADLGAKPFTEFVGEDQFLYQIFNFGLSDVDLSDYQIGDTPIGNYEGVVIQESGSDGALTLFPGNVDALAGGDLKSVDGWMQRTSSLEATALTVELIGILLYAGDGGPIARVADFAIQYRAVGSGTWLNLVYQGTPAGGTVINPAAGIVHNFKDSTVANAEAGVAIRITNGSSKPVRRHYKWYVASGQYEVRVKRVTPDETDSRATSDFTWSQLLTYQPDTANYDGQKRVALSIRATGQLNGSVATFNALANAKCPVWNGSGWVTQATSNPSWWFLWLARGKYDIASGRRLYGGGLTDSRIDIEKLKLFGDWCDAKALTCNLVFDRAMMVNDMLATIARCGRGAGTWASGTLGVVWDAGGQPAVAVFGMSNIKRGSFEVQYITAKLADEFVVQFVNPALNWQVDTARAMVPGVSVPAITAAAELFGCTDPDMAGREANLLAAALAYRRRRITWDADMEGLVVNRGDVVYLSHDLTQWGYSGRLVSGSTMSLQLDRTVPFTAGPQHYIGVRFPDGSYGIYDVVNSVGTGESDTILLSTPLPNSPDALTNILPNTEQFDLWTVGSGSVTVTPDDHVDPLGRMTADTLVFSATPNANIYDVATPAAMNGTYTLDGWLDSSAGPADINIQVLSLPAFQFSSEQTIAITPGSMQKYSFTVTVSGVTTDDQLRVYLVTRDSVARTIHAWGWRLEPAGALQHPPCDCIWMFAPQATPGKRVKITDIQPQGMETVKISATDEDDAYYLAEFNTYTYLTGSSTAKLPTLSNLQVIENLTLVGSGYGVSLVLTWQTVGEYGSASIRVGLNGGPLEHKGDVIGSRFEFQMPANGQLQIEVTGHNLRGQYGSDSVVSTPYTIIGKAAPPPDALTLFATTLADGTRSFAWTANVPADLAGYELRYTISVGALWDQMLPLHTGLLLASPYETNQLSPGTYTFGIKLKDTSGNYSANAIYYTATLAQQRVADAFYISSARAEGWPGTKTSCHVDDTGDLIADDGATWDTLPATWDLWTSWTFAPASPITYEHTADLGVVYTYTPVVSYDALGTVTVEESHSNDGSTWSAYTASWGVVTARYQRIRATVTATVGQPTPTLRQLDLIFSAKEIKEEFLDVNTSTWSGTTGDRRIPITSTYFTIRSVQLALQNVGSGWSWEIIDKDNALGPRIKIYNGATLADCVVDAIIKGN